MARGCASLGIVLWNFDVGTFPSSIYTDFMSIRNVAWARVVPTAYTKSIFDVRQPSAEDATRGLGSYCNSTTQLRRQASSMSKAIRLRKY